MTKKDGERREETRETRGTDSFDKTFIEDFEGNIMRERE